MGLLDRFTRIKDPIRGTARVVSATGPPHEAMSGPCRMHLVVTVPGHEAFAVHDSYIVSVKKWPQPGTELPIEASRSRPDKFKILWKEVTPLSEVAAGRAQQLAAALNQGPVPDAGAGQHPANEDRIVALERLAALRDAGALTEEEFAAEKRRILGG